MQATGDTHSGTEVPHCSVCGTRMPALTVATFYYSKTSKFAIVSGSPQQLSERPQIRPATKMRPAILTASDPDERSHFVAQLPSHQGDLQDTEFANLHGFIMR
jgi:hypothetical protein